TVGERPAILQRDRPVLAVLGLERLCDLVDDVAVLGVRDQAREDRGEDLSATGLRGIGRDQRVLRLAAVGGDDGRAVAAICRCITAGCASGQRERAGRKKRNGGDANACSLQFFLLCKWIHGWPLWGTLHA